MLSPNREEVKSIQDFDIMSVNFKVLQRELVELNADGQDDEAPIGAE